MNKLKRSILQQKAKRTYHRNLIIRQLSRDGESDAEIGRRYGITRQAVRAIRIQEEE